MHFVMIRLVHTFVSWSLVAIVLAGNLPALVHRMDCANACGLASCDVHEDESSTDNAAHESKPCCQHQHAQVGSEKNSEVGRVKSDTLGLRANRLGHDCQSCAICKSLHSINGFGIGSEASQSFDSQLETLLTYASLAPKLERFGLSQSRAPPAMF